jgi:hypothetical protein
MTGTFEASRGAVMGYQVDQWHDLFVAIAGAAATLAGLIFVAVSINLRQILKGPALPSLAARSLAVLIALVLMCTFALAPGQSRTVLGVEILIVGILLSAGVTITTIRTMGQRAAQAAQDDRDDEDHEFRRWWQISHIIIGLHCTTPMVVCGISLLAGAGGGLYWALAEIVAGLVASVTYAWVLLVEILR